MLIHALISYMIFYDRSQMVHVVSNFTFFTVVATSSFITLTCTQNACPGPALLQPPLSWHKISELTIKMAIEFYWRMLI